MKGTVRTVMFLAVAVINAALSGCSPEKKISYFYDVAEATSSVRSYSGVTETNISLFYGETGVSVKLTRNISLQDEPFFADIDEDLLINTNGDSQTEKSRLIVDGTGSADIVYLFKDEVWENESVELEDLRTEISPCDVTENGVMLIKAAANIQEIGTDNVNGQDTKVYEGIIPKIMIPDILEITGASYKFRTDWDSSYYEDVSGLPVTLWINSENIIVAYELDITDIMQNIVNVFYTENDIEGQYEPIRFEEFKQKGIVTDFNNTINISVPDEALYA